MHDTCITSPAQLIAAVPSLLGFQPVDSLTAIWAGADSIVVWTLRYDLDAPVEEMGSRLLELALRTSPGRLYLVAYSDIEPAWLDELLEALEVLDLPDVLLVGATSWRSLLCTSSDCCPESGHPLPEGVSPVEAERVLRGQRAVAPSREELVAAYALRPEEQPTKADLERVTVDGGIAARCEQVLGRLRLLPQTSIGSRARSQAMAAVMVLLQDREVRDLLLAHVIDADDADALVDALVTVALRSPEELRPITAGAAAVALYANGGSSVASWALVEHAGEDSLAGLVGVALQAMLPPSELRSVFRQARTLLEERQSA